MPFGFEQGVFFQANAIKSPVQLLDTLRSLSFNNHEEIRHSQHTWSLLTALTPPNIRIAIKLA